MNTSAFHWDEALELGDAAMDATHREFVDCVGALIAAPQADLAPSLDACARHLRAHFAHEDQAMRDSAFSESRCHIEEHAKVLASLAQVQEAVAAGRPEVARAFGRALERWFPEHVQVMDGSLARWLATRRWGGAPIRIARARQREHDLAAGHFSGRAQG